MGLAKSMMMEEEERGWTSVDKSVCPDCVGEPVLAAAVQAAADSDTCDYCGTTGTEPLGVIVRHEAR